MFFRASHSRPPAPMPSPPRLDPALFERFEGLRETTLAAFTDPTWNATLRCLIDLLYTMACDYSRHWPHGPEGSFRHEARAGVADLRHLQGYLAYLGRAADVSALTPAEARISRRCRGFASRVREVANALEAELDRGREAPPESS